MAGRKLIHTNTRWYDDCRIKMDGNRKKIKNSERWQMLRAAHVQICWYLGERVKKCRGSTKPSSIKTALMQEMNLVEKGCVKWVGRRQSSTPIFEVRVWTCGRSCAAPRGGSSAPPVLVPMGAPVRMPRACATLDKAAVTLYQPRRHRPRRPKQRRYLVFGRHHHHHHHHQQLKHHSAFYVSDVARVLRFCCCCNFSNSFDYGGLALLLRARFPR